MLGLRMLIMPFNLAIAVAATIALTYYCYVVLLFVWRALDTGFLPNWNYVRYDEPGKYWSRPVWLSVFGSFAGLRLFVAASGSFLSVGPIYQTKSAPAWRTSALKVTVSPDGATIHAESRLPAFGRRYGIPSPQRG